VTLTPPEIDSLLRGAAASGVVLGKSAVEDLERYVDELRRWLPRMNLVSRGDTASLVGRHIVDSLAAAPLLEPTPTDAIIADIGSGAGLPGVPLAVALAPRRFVLVEPRRKRASFLRAVGRSLEGAHLEVREARVEELGASDLRGRLAAAVTRASLPTSVFLQGVHPLLAPGGLAVAYRGQGAGSEPDSPGFGSPEVLRHPTAPTAHLVHWRRSTGS
jgi:16S rRNA (guanine527-N7)-methyltransferase